MVLCTNIKYCFNELFSFDNIVVEDSAMRNERNSCACSYGFQILAVNEYTNAVFLYRRNTITDKNAMFTICCC